MSFQKREATELVVGFADGTERKMDNIHGLDVTPEKITYYRMLAGQKHSHSIRGWIIGWRWCETRQVEWEFWVPDDEAKAAERVSRKKKGRGGR